MGLTDKEKEYLLKGFDVVKEKLSKEKDKERSKMILVAFLGRKEMEGMFLKESGEYMTKGDYEEMEAEEIVNQFVDSIPEIKEWIESQ